MMVEPTPSEAAPSGLEPPRVAMRSTATVQGVTERLQQSRRVMREQMLALNTASVQAQAARRHAQQHPGALRAALGALPLIGPLINPLIDSAVAWWDSHPLRAVADLFAARPASSAAAPLTHRHPWAVLASAAVAGALLMGLQPWRHRLLRRAIYAGVIPRLLTSLLSSLPTEHWGKLAEGLLRRSHAPAPQAAQAPASASVSPSPSPSPPPSSATRGGP